MQTDDNKGCQPEMVEMVEIGLGDIPGTDSPPDCRDTMSSHPRRDTMPPPLLEDDDSANESMWTKIPEKFEKVMFHTPIPLCHTNAKWLRFPFFTITVSLVDIALMIWVLSIDGFASPDQNPMLGPPSQVLIDSGAKVTSLILAGQWWRLISAMFLHVGIVHLLFNLFMQVIIGIILERRYDCIRVAVIYLISGIGGDVASAVFLPRYATVGASGALFGLLAMWTVMIFQDYHELKRPRVLIISTLISIVISFVLGLLPLADNFVHLGGFLVGLELSIVIVPKITRTPTWKFWGRTILSIVFAILFLATFIGLFVALYLAPPATEWCPNCQYLNCLPSWC